MKLPSAPARASCSMPAPLVHIAYAVAYSKQRPELDEALLVRGTAFPDIRRMAGLSREVTHHYGLTLSDVAAETDAWQAGFLLHSYLDKAWDEYFASRGMVDGEPSDDLHRLAVKLAEEADYYGMSTPNNALAQVFELAPLPQELALGASAEIIQRWNSFVSWKLSTPHGMASWEYQAERVGYEPHEIAKVMLLVKEIRGSEAWQERLSSLHHDLGI